MEKNVNGFEYDAFISYRHADMDKFVAENLHKFLETYKIPKSVSENIAKKSINRVFRDEEELPLAMNLEDSIVHALKESENLICICSPRFLESKWCMKEIDTFIELHGREHIYTVLIDDNPDASFPPQLLAGNIEPLAANLSSKSKSEIKKKLKIEGLRLVAPILGVSFDDLKQRHKERKMKKNLLISLCVMIFAVLFGLYSSFNVIQISQQRDEIAAQAQSLEQQAAEIEEQATQLEKQNAILLKDQALSLSNEASFSLEDNDRLKAIYTAREALSSYKNMEMPYVPESQFVLTKALHLYDAGSVVYPQYKLDMFSSVTQVDLSPNKQYVMARDESGLIRVWDLLTSKELYSVNVGLTTDVCGFINDATIFYSIDRDLYLYDLEKGTEEQISSYVEYAEVSKNNEYFAYSSDGIVHIFDSDFNEISNIETEIFVSAINFDENNSMVCISINKFTEENEYTNYCYDLETHEMKVFDTKGLITSIEYDTNGNVYVITNYYEVFIDRFYCIYSYDFNSGSLKQLLLINNWNADDILFLSDYIYIANDSFAYFYDKQTGAMVNSLNVGYDIIFSQVSEDNGIIILDSEGTCSYFTPDSPLTFSFDQYYQCSGLERLYKAYNCIVGYKDNSVIVLNKFLPERAVEYNDTCEDAEEIEVHYINIDGIDYLQSFGIEDIFDVNTYTFIPGTDYLIIQYIDNEVIIYDTEHDKELGRFVKSTPFYFTNYFGQDVYGTYYFGSELEAYGFNPDYGVICEIPYMQGLTSDKESVIVYNSVDTYYSLSILSLDEIMNYADIELEKYDY